MTLGHAFVVKRIGVSVVSISSIFCVPAASELKCVGISTVENFVIIVDMVLINTRISKHVEGRTMRFGNESALKERMFCIALIAVIDYCKCLRVSADNQMFRYLFADAVHMLRIFRVNLINHTEGVWIGTRDTLALCV